MEIHVPIAYHANDNMQMLSPHSTLEGAVIDAKKTCEQDKSLYRYEVFTFDLIED